MTQDQMIFQETRARFGKQEITDGTARAIASTFHDGGTVALAFVSTGVVPENSSELWRALAVPEYDTESSDWRKALDMLGTYLLTNRGRGEVTGWSSLWIGDNHA